MAIYYETVTGKHCLMEPTFANMYIASIILSPDLGRLAQVTKVSN
jgi:hypothetical protein